MKKSKFSDRQILSILKQHEGGVPVAELAREHGGQHGADLPMARQIWRDGRVVNEGNERATCRERSPEEDVR